MALLLLLLLLLVLLFTSCENGDVNDTSGGGDDAGSCVDDEAVIYRIIGPMGIIWDRVAPRVKVMPIAHETFSLKK